MKKNTSDQHYDEWSVYDTRLTQFIVIQTIHCNVGLNFFQFYQNVRLLLSLCMHILFIFHKVV